MYKRYRMFGIEKWVLSIVGDGVFCQNVSHPAGDMPSTVCLVLGWFRWGTAVYPLFQSWFGPVFAPGLWAASGRCQPPRWTHAFYGVFSSLGLIPMGYCCIPFISVLVWSSFCPWFVSGFWPILTHNPTSWFVIIYTLADVRDSNIMDFSRYVMINTWRTSIVSAATAQSRPPAHEVGPASKPTPWAWVSHITTRHGWPEK